MVVTQRRIRELESELAFYRSLFADCCVLEAASAALDALPDDPEAPGVAEAWSAYWDAADEVFDYVRTIEHADAMDAAGVTCNELLRLTPSA